MLVRSWSCLQVCNHPQLFEETVERQPLHFAAVPAESQPAGFGEVEWISHTGCYSEVCFQLPRLVYEEGMPALSPSHTGHTSPSPFLRTYCMSHQG